MQRSTRHVLAAFIGIGLIVLIWLAPDIGTSQTGPNGVIEAYRGRIESIAFPSTDPNAETPPVPIAHVRILDGPKANQAIDAILAGPGGSQDTSTYAAGQEVVVTFTVQPDGSDPYVEVSDHWRIPGLGILGLIFAAAVVFVGGWHGRACARRPRSDRGGHPEGPDPGDRQRRAACPARDRRRHGGDGRHHPPDRGPDEDKPGGHPRDDERPGDHGAPGGGRDRVPRVHLYGGLGPRLHDRPWRRRPRPARCPPRGDHPRGGRRARRRHRDPGRARRGARGEGRTCAARR